MLTTEINPNNPVPLENTSLFEICGIISDKLIEYAKDNGIATLATFDTDIYQLFVANPHWVSSLPKSVLYTEVYYENIRQDIHKLQLTVKERVIRDAFYFRNLLDIIVITSYPTYPTTYDATR